MADLDKENGLFTPEEVGIYTNPEFKITGGNSRLLVSGMKAGFLQDFMYI